MSNNLECFNNILRDFIKELIAIFPKYKDVLTDNYSGILEGKTTNNHVKDYIDNVSEYINDITKHNDNIFKENNELYFIKGINFCDLWKESMTKNTKNQIWKYLKTLFLIGKKVLETTDDINTIINNFKNNEDFDMSNLDEESKSVLNVLESMSEVTDEDKIKNYEDALSKSSIGKLASELVEEINIDQSGLENCDNPADIFKNLIGSNFMNIVGKVGNKLQEKMDEGELNERDLITDAQNLMSMMSGSETMGDLFSMFQNNQSNNQSNNRSNQPSNRSSNSSQSRANRRRERLRKKLEMRKKKN